MNQLAFQISVCLCNIINFIGCHTCHCTNQSALSYILNDTLAVFKYGVNTDVNIGVSVTRGGNTLFEVMGIC